VEYLTDFTLTGLEEKLSDPFLRVHRAYMVNRDKIKEVHRGFNGTFILTMKDKNSTRINTGRSYNDVVRRFFEL
jgi:DNA-binding LytR/AlgR family response regulator